MFNICPPSVVGLVDSKVPEGVVGLDILVSVIIDVVIIFFNVVLISWWG